MKTIRLYFSKAEKALYSAVFAALGMVSAAFAAFVNFCMACVQSPRFATVLVCLGVVGTVFAANGTAGDYTAGTTALGNVSTEIAKYIPVVVKLCYAIAGVVAVVGAISIYIAMNNEEQDVKKKIMMTVGACIFLIAAAQALPLFFSVDSTSGAFK